jgi:SOS-response transcriptional repressor LexA
MSRGELSRLSGLSSKQISDIEKGISGTTPRTIRRLSEALDFHLAYFEDDINHLIEDGVINNSSHPLFDSILRSAKYRYKKSAFDNIGETFIKPVEAIMHAPGQPTETGEYIYCTANEAKPNIHALKVQGDCMIEYGIYDGTILFVDTEISPYSGCDVLVYHNGSEHPKVIKYKSQEDIQGCIYYGVIEGRYLKGAK